MTDNDKVTSSPDPLRGAATERGHVVEPVSTGVRPAVEVVAPMDMESGYRFSVTTAGNHQTLRVQVPEGNGVVAGQRFAAWVIQEDVTQRSVMGWRDGYFRCFKHGICNAMMCLGCWCAPCLLGQVMTRAKLDITGNPRISDEKTFWTPFKFLWALTAAYILMRGTTQTILNRKVDVNDDGEDGDNTDDTNDEYPYWAETLIFFRFLVFLSYSIFVLILIIKTRSYLRKKNNIPAETCGRMEDCCMSFFCPCCTVCHLARHTNDYDTYSARCCTDTGLSEDAPLHV